MAKTLYDYWFVQFEFPDANGKPYKSSGGKMAYNEVLKREIPARWRVSQLTQHLNCNEKKLGKKHTFSNIMYLDTSSLTKNMLDSLQLLTFGTDKIPSRANMLVGKNDILYSTVRPNQCHYGIIKKPVDNMVASTGYAVFSHKDNIDFNIIFYHLITSTDCTEKLVRISETSKSSYPSISPEDILNLQIALPEDDELLNSISAILNPVYDKIAECQQETANMEALRDWLLPMLMNGQVTVK